MSVLPWMINHEASAMESLGFEQIETISLTERVIAALKSAFFSGKLQPGDTIVERQIARELNVGTPVVREALISLKHDGFVRRVNNKGSFVTSFTAEEVRQLYELRIEMETLALQWARVRVSEADIQELRGLVDKLVDAGQRDSRREFLECDFEFHRCCWRLSGNPFLARTLEQLMAPLFAFVVLASGSPLTASMAREHSTLVDALQSVPEPEFSTMVRKTFTAFALRWTSATPRAAAGNSTEGG